MSSFTCPFKVKVHNVKLKDKPFEVDEEFMFYSEVYKDMEIVVPIGYRSDFASIPRIFRTMLSSVGRYSKAAVVHDYMIDEMTEVGMKKINKLFLEGMEVLGVGKVTRYTIYNGVRFYWKFLDPVSKFFKTKRK